MVAIKVWIGIRDILIHTVTLLYSLYYTVYTLYRNIMSAFPVLNTPFNDVLTKHTEH